MAHAPEVTTEPALLLGGNTNDLTVAARIRSFDEGIKAEPDAFMESCRTLGGVAVEHMDASEPADAEKVEHLTISLKGFLERNDLVHTEFDPESDDAIYEHPGVLGLIRTVKNTKGHTRKSGGKIQHIENPNSVILRDNLSALKLFLYAKRVKQWNETQAAVDSLSPDHGNGAA